MQKTVRLATAALLTVLLGVFAVFPASAAEKKALPEPTAAVQQWWVDAADTLQLQEIIPLRLSDDDVDSISDRLSGKSDVYLVKLTDGRYTYYITVDLREDDAAYLRNLRVLRQTSHKLYDRSAAMAKKDRKKSPVLMDYTHIVGELEAHYLVFHITDVLGGESTKGLLGKLYRQSAVADLNIDEERMAVPLRMLGLLIGE